MAKLAEVERQIDDLVQKFVKARIKTGHMVSTSPIDGTVQGMTLTSVGQVVSTRRILNYLFSPLVEVVSTAMRER